MGTDNAAAIVGMACRFPGAPSVREYWSVLRRGAEGISHFGPGDLAASGADPELLSCPEFVPAKGVVAGSTRFDWSFFGYSRAEAASIDPQQRIFLECATAAVDDAGIDPERFPGWIGVYGGADPVTTPPPEGMSKMAQVIGQGKDFLATRVAYKLGLRGPAITVQTACSTSLTAVHMAVQSLLSYECDAALAGGVAAAAPDRPGYLYEEGGILSPDGHCRPFDERSAGTVPSEGVGVVVLKRLADALRDGDRIAALILGSAVNNDGGDKMGYTAPSVSGQRDAIALAQKVADVDPADIDYVEAHGTGTRIGDPIEVQALTDAFRAATAATGFCWLGAAKSNLGHTGAAAGVAGLIKTALMLEHGELVPTVHFSRPNPLLSLETTPFLVCAGHQPWPDRGTPLAAVSAFGVGGTNVHLIAAGPPARTRPTPRKGPWALPLSAASADGLGRLRRDLAGHLDTETATSLPEVSRTLAGRRGFAHRLAVVADAPAEAARLLREAADPPPASRLDHAAFLFPGHGTLSHPAAAAAYRLLTGFRAYFDEMADAVRDGHGIDLAPVVSSAGAAPDWYRDLLHQHLGLLAIGYALGRQLLDWGIRPAAMLGNSIGEYAAATVAGVWAPPDAAALVYERASAMRATEPGKLVAVGCAPDELTERLGRGGAAAIAVAGPGRIVISGAEAAMSDLLAGDALRGLDVWLVDAEETGHAPAAHSAVMRPVAKVVRDMIPSLPSRPPALPLVSNVTGDWADPQAWCSAGYWAEQVCRTVLLERGMTTMLAAGCDTFIEVGPGTSMTGGMRRHQDWDPGHTAVPMLGRAEDDGELALLRALGTLWERGAGIPLDEIPGGERPLRCSLPGRPFDSRDPAASEDDTPASASVTAAPAGRELPRAVLERLWCQALGVRSAGDHDDFFALGGESLMAVNLMTQVRKQLACDVSAADFSRAATFGRLVRLAGAQDRASAGRIPGIVTLREGGGEEPLFLAADAIGTAMGYRRLAAGLGDGRPVYGLEPVPGTVRRAFPRVGDIAAQHVDALVRVQRSGPYTVGGWSFGAVVAHEMARQLTEGGERVRALVCLDGFVPDRWGLPAAADPLFLAGALRLGASALLGAGAAAGQIRGAPELRWLFTANIGALLRYRPRPVACPAIVFAARTDRRAVDRVRRRIAGLYPGGVRVHGVPGDHWSMLTEPHVSLLARRLREELPAESISPRGASDG